MAQTRFGRYEIKSEIGRGGMATVYLAHDVNFKRDVALKALPIQFTHDRSFQYRFEQEAQVLAALEHQAIVPVYDYGEERGYPFIVMRYMSGGALTTRIASRQLQMSDVAKITQRIGGALDEAHSQGIVHRDLKPGNILFDQHDQAYLADFGIARLAESTASFTGSAIIGTPAYMSPEQVHGSRDIDGRSDIYAMGIIIFEMLAGKVPYAADTPTKQMMAHVLEPVPDILELYPDLPPALAAAVARTLAKDPDDRFQTGAELGAAIAAAVSGDVAEVKVPAALPAGPPTLPGTIPPAKTAGKRASRISMRLLAIMGILALAAVACVVAAIFGVNYIGSLSEGTATQVVAEEQETAVTGTPEPEESATPTPAETASVTKMPTKTPASRLTPTPIAEIMVSQSAPTPVFQVQVDTGSVNFRTGPGTTYGLVAGRPFLQFGELLILLARTANSSWFNVETEDGFRGWTAASVVRLIHPETAEEVSIAATIPPAPTRTSVPSSTRIPTNTPVPQAPPPKDTNTPVPTRTTPPTVTRTTVPTNTAFPTSTPFPTSTTPPTPAPEAIRRPLPPT